MPVRRLHQREADLLMDSSMLNREDGRNAGLILSRAAYEAAMSQVDTQAIL
jgi:hypothetical protein